MEVKTVEFEVKLLRGKRCLIVAEVWYEIEEAECSSNCGDQYVTERWECFNVDSVYIVSIDAQNKDGEYIDVYHNSLTESERHKINCKAEEQLLRDTEE
jgi:hypothetical protein